MNERRRDSTMPMIQVRFTHDVLIYRMESLLTTSRESPSSVSSTGLMELTNGEGSG